MLMPLTVDESFSPKKRGWASGEEFMQLPYLM